MSTIPDILRARTPGRGTLIVALQEIQAAEGHIPRERIPEIARAFGLTDSEVFGVISFYTDLRFEKEGETTVRVCCGDSCAATDGYRILRSVADHLGISPEETTKDGKATLRIAYCLGNCALSPSMMIGDRVYGRLTPKQAVQIVDKNVN
ncbi:MAG: NAD(P)H-dependent oxidoreductase subunit E [Candidatus Latescibacteria bacterium]|nr:NAD(P)H-dependent oxidoreductase subunit E [Candidatus Latescibacterota bacterium]